MTVSAGIDELDVGEDPTPGRSRRPGGGRKSLPETDPDLVGAENFIHGP